MAPIPKKKENINAVECVHRHCQKLRNPIYTEMLKNATRKLITTQFMNQTREREETYTQNEKNKIKFV